MIELYQNPWSPFCIVTRRILEYSNAPHKIVNVSNVDRSLVWRLTKQRYYGIPILRDGKSVVFETEETSQVIAKYLDLKLGLGLFPRHWEGVQRVLWRFIENEVEGFTFKLNDVYFAEFIPAREHLPFIRHKERKFGRGCIDAWRKNTPALKQGLAAALLDFEEMLFDKPFLLDEQPRFVDFDLFGMLGNFLYSGRHAFPKTLPRLKRWHQRMAAVQHSSFS